MSWGLCVALGQTVPLSPAPILPNSLKKPLLSLHDFLFPAPGALQEWLEQGWGPRGPHKAGVCEVSPKFGMNSAPIPGFGVGLTSGGFEVGEVTPGDFINEMSLVLGILTPMW